MTKSWKKKPTVPLVAADRLFTRNELTRPASSPSFSMIWELYAWNCSWSWAA